MNVHTRDRRVTIASLENAFRGIARVSDVKTGKDGQSCNMNLHGTRVHFVIRKDGVCFVNCAGRTAILARNPLSIRHAVVQAVRK